ncbi:MAG: chemotaxis protein CheX [Bacteroidales bacterium]|nr:chemotaxis protein CheX [Candidatus Latescibacterota bacterium]
MDDAVITKNEKWLHAMSASLEELATGMLGFDGSSITGMEDGLPDKINGAHVAMISLHESLNVGLFADNKDCVSLAKAMLCMEEDDEISEEDVRDSMGEIVNIIAGGVKRRMIEDIPTIKIGLPVFFAGYMTPGKNVDSSVIDVMIGPIEARLFLIIDTST